MSSFTKLTQAIGAVTEAAAFTASDKTKLLALVQSADNSDDDDDEQGAPAPNSYESHSGGIVDVLNGMKEKAEGELKELRKAESNAAQNFNMLKGSLEGQIGADTKDLEEEKSTKAANEEQKATDSGDLAMTEKDLAEAQASLAKISHDCLQTAADHEATVASREEELKVIATAKKILQETSSGAVSQSYDFLQMNSQMRTRTDLVKSEVLTAVKTLARKSHSSALAQLASKMSVVMQYGGANQADVFAKIKGLVQDMIAKLEKEAEEDAAEKAYCDEEMAKTEAKKQELDDEIAKLTSKIDKAAAKSTRLKGEVKEAQATPVCTASSDSPAIDLDFIITKGDALLAQIEDDVRMELAKMNMNVKAQFLEKDDFNTAMTTGNFNLCFSETWGPPYDPHTYAASWKAPDEAHFAAMQGIQNPTRAELFANITNVLLEENLAAREQKWSDILSAVHMQAIDLPFSGKRIPTVLGARLSGYVPGQQQFEYPVHTLQVLSGSKTITVAPGAQSGLFSTVGRLDPHTYRPNEFFANNWVYEGLVKYGANGVVEPALAESWTVSATPSGGEQYHFKLRQGVKFHDGADWNCAVAKLNFDHCMTPALTTGDWHGWYDLPKQLDTWSCTGTYDFVVTTKGKYYPFLQELSYIRPLRMLSPNSFVNGISTSPKTHNSCHKGWGNITGNGETITCAGITSVSGTGPFSYVETLGNGDATFNRHAQYWHSVPEVESIVVKKFATSAEVMAALQAGTLDAVMGAGVLEPRDLKTIQTQHTSTHQVFLGPPIQNRIIILNANKAPTNNITLRKVIMHAVHKADIIDKELYGFASPVDALFPKNAPYCDVDLTPRWDYDLEKAKLLRCPAVLSQGTTAECKNGLRDYALTPAQGSGSSPGPDTGAVNIGGSTSSNNTSGTANGTSAGNGGTDGEVASGAKQVAVTLSAVSALVCSAVMV